MMQIFEYYRKLLDIIEIVAYLLNYKQFMLDEVRHSLCLTHLMQCL